MNDFEMVIRRAGGICATREFRDAGVGARVLQRAVSTGELRRLRRGLYALADTEPDRVLAARFGGRLAGLSAAASFGLWGGWENRLHLVIPNNSARIPPRAGHDETGRRTIEGRDVVLHWRDDAHDVESRWRVSLQRCIRQVLRWHDLETGLAVVESALAVRIIGTDELPRLARGLHPALGRAVVACRAGAQSGLETIVRLRLEKIGFVVERQSRVGNVGHVDLRIVGTRVIVEIDGYAFHSSRREFTEDRRRDAEAAAQGLVALRFTSDQVEHRWPWVERMIVDAVAVR